MYDKNWIFNVGMVKPMLLLVINYRPIISIKIAWGASTNSGTTQMVDMKYRVLHCCIAINQIVENCSEYYSVGNRFISIKSYNHIIILYSSQIIL